MMTMNTVRVICILTICAVLGILLFPKILKKPKQNIEYESMNYFDFKVRNESSPFEPAAKDKFFREFFKQKQESSHNELKYRNNKAWELMGPFEIAGRSLSIAINPFDTSEIWAGMAGSGLWKSNSGGLGKNAWHYVKTGYPVQAVSAIAIHPLQKEIIYIGTGELYNVTGNEGFVNNRVLRGSRGIGILKSENGGRTWDLIYDYSNQANSCIWKICIHPTVPNVMYAATTEGVLKSVNGGRDWEWVFTGGIVSDMAMDPMEPETLYLGVGGIGSLKYGLYKTTSGGESWTLIESPAGNNRQGRIMVHIHPIYNQSVLAAYADDFYSVGILRTTDGFNQTKYYTKIKDVCEHQGWYAKGLLLKADEPDKLLMGGVDLYYDSTGTGNKFLNLVHNKISIHADFHEIISNPLDANKVYFATDGGIYRSDDFAKTVYQCNSGLLSTQFYNGSVSSINGYIMGGLQDNGTVLRTATNWNWFKFGDGTFNSFSNQNDSTYYLSTQYQYLFKSTNNGFKWNTLIQPNQQAPFISPFIVHPVNDDIIVSGGNSLLISYDGGNKFTTAQSFPDDTRILTLAFNPNNSGYLFYSTLDVKSDVTSLYSLNIQTLKSTTVAGFWNGRIIRDLSFSKTDHSLGYLALGGYGQPGIMRSMDSGNSFNYPLNESLPDVPFHAVLSDPKNPSVVYAGCDLGLYVSRDYGDSWESYNFHPFDLVPVYDLQYSEKSDKIIIFSHGFGMFSCERLELPVTNNKQEIYVYDVYVYSRDRFITKIKLPEKCNPILTDIEGKILPITFNGDLLDLGIAQSGVYFLSIKGQYRKCYKLIIP